MALSLKGWETTSQVAARIGITPRAIQRLAVKHDIGWRVKVGNRFFFMFNAQDLAQLREVAKPGRGRPSTAKGKR
jgi:hypothetical protein